MVPVVKDVDKKGLFEIALEISELSNKARAGKISPKDLQGGCFTISSLGGIGGLHFTPIINTPEVAIEELSNREDSINEPQWSEKQKRYFCDLKDKKIIPDSLLPSVEKIQELDAAGKAIGKIFAGDVIEKLKSCADKKHDNESLKQTG